jgi:hypothetical protein
MIASMELIVEEENIFFVAKPYLFFVGIISMPLDSAPNSFLLGTILNLENSFNIPKDPFQ